jgi:Cft2 family RNA processing exonuclease
LVENPDSLHGQDSATDSHDLRSLEIDPTQPQLDSSIPSEPSAPQGALETAVVLIRATVGGRFPSGPLGPDSVPPKLLALPIEIAIEDLVRHKKHCKKPHCPYFPPSLLRFDRMRPDAIRNAPDEVHKALWLYPDHELVTGVRKKVLAQETDLVDQISSGRILRAESLSGVLEDKNHGFLRLAAVLWALKFGPPESESLFRALVPLTQRAPSLKEASTEGAPLKEAKKEIRRLEHALKESERLADDLSRRLRAGERAYQKVKPELDAEKQKNVHALEQIEVLEEQALEAGRDLRLREGDLARATEINDQLRDDLHCQQEELRKLEDERGDLASKVASLRRTVENTQRELGSVPTGSIAVLDFLDAETARIQDDLLILSGGANLRAKQEWTTHRNLQRAFFDAYPSLREPPPIKIRPKTPLRLVALGGSSEIGRSCYLIELGDSRILVDCGLKPKSPQDLLPAIDKLERVDCLILTHAHTDHVGWLPALIRRFPRLNIYCSGGTAALLPVVLADCHQHYLRKLLKRRYEAQFTSSRQEVLEAYDENDVNKISKLAIACEFDQKETLLGDISATFFRAGHILGAASVLIEDQSGRRIFLSGDFSSLPQLTVKAARWPEDMGEVDLLVLESTYGSRDRHDPFEVSRGKLLDFIKETTASGGSVILASFAIGRAQELLKLIVTAKENGELPDLPVHVDGMINRVNPIYRRFGDFAVPAEAFNEVSGQSDRHGIVVSAESKPVIIITTSGMLAGGPVVEYAKRMLPDPRHRIVLTGYQDETAPSQALIEITSGSRGRVVHLEDERGDKIKFEAAMMAKEIKLSAHADRAGLVEYSLRMRPRYIALVHGEPQSQKDLAHFLRSEHPRAEIVCGPDDMTIP